MTDGDDMKDSICGSWITFGAPAFRDVDTVEAGLEENMEGAIASIARILFAKDAGSGTCVLSLSSAGAILVPPLVAVLLSGSTVHWYPISELVQRRSDLVLTIVLTI